MKKILLFLTLMIFFIAPANAKATLVEAMTPYNSENPTDIIVFRVVNANTIESYGTVYSGDIIFSVMCGIIGCNSLKDISRTCFNILCVFNFSFSSCN